jgi:hypothetical protein
VCFAVLCCTLLHPSIWRQRKARLFSESPPPWGDFVKSEILDDKKLASFASEKMKFYEIGVTLPVRSGLSSLSYPALS